MHHSRAAALLVGDYLDRTNDFGVLGAIPVIIRTLAATYTVGANIEAMLQWVYILLGGTAAAQTLSVEIVVNRNGAFNTEARYSLAGLVNTFSTLYDLPLLAGDTIQIYYTCADATGPFIDVRVFVQEIDL